METDEKLKLGYQGALQMVGITASVLWQSFNSILTANTVLATISGIALKIFPQWAPILLSSIGLLVCLAWYFATKGHFSYYKYYLNWARSLEKRTLAPEVAMLERGRDYGAGAEVLIPEAGTWQMRWSARVFLIEWLAVMVIGVFGLVYVILFAIAMTCRSLCSPGLL